MIFFFFFVNFVTTAELEDLNRNCVLLSGVPIAEAILHKTSCSFFLDRGICPYKTRTAPRDRFMAGAVTWQQSIPCSSRLKKQRFYQINPILLN